MRIFLACPAPPRSLRGNRVTAARWTRLLRSLGHRVRVGVEWDGRPCDLLIALHARKSHAAIARYRGVHPRGPLVVCLTGTDLYHDLPRCSEARQSLTWADRIVVLQEKALDELTPSWRAKARVIHQSSTAPERALRRPARTFDCCVLGHLRSEKDPMRAALALRRLPAESRIRLFHAGKALTDSWAALARHLMQRQPRYRWLGEISQGRARRLLARSHAMIISSQMEGGANVVSEAIVLGVPVLASRIPGNVGLLGDEYPGYFPVGDTAALAQLMARAERDAAFYDSLRAGVRRRQRLFRPAVELRAWRELLRRLPRPWANDSSK